MAYVLQCMPHSTSYLLTYMREGGPGAEHRAVRGRSEQLADQKSAELGSGIGIDKNPTRCIPVIVGDGFTMCIRTG